MRIAVISDTHDRFPESLPERLRGADEIWHLGDVCDPLTLVEFELLRVPLRVVAGNCDEHAWPLSLTLESDPLSLRSAIVFPPEASGLSNASFT